MTASAATVTGRGSDGLVSASEIPAGEEVLFSTALFYPQMMMMMKK
jgi:hypothetical protein